MKNDKSKNDIFSNDFMKSSPIFFKSLQELYYMMLTQMSVITVCHNSGGVYNWKSKWQALNDQKTTTLQVQKVIIFSHKSMKSSSIFFKFLQELLYDVQTNSSNSL